MTKNMIPEIRFEGFDREWEKIKVREILDIKNNDRVPVKESERINGVTPYYGANGIIDYVEGYTHNGTYVLLAEDGASDLGDYPVNLVSGKSWINNHAHVIDPLKNNPYFISNTFKKVNYHKYISGSSRYKLNLDSLVGISIKVTVVEEQEKIGRLFEILDDLIEGQEEVVEKSKDLKKSFLQKLLPKEGASQPELRFPGFGGDYKTFRLKDISKRITRKNTNNESKIPLTISAEDGIINQNLYYNNRVASKDLSNYYLIKKGEFAYNKSYSKNAPLGAIKKLEYYDQGALSSLYIVFDIINQNKLYMSTYFDSHHWHKEIYKVAAEGARNHGLLNIGVDDFFDIKIKLPSLAEQEKIGSFFKSLDEKIEREEDRLEAYKGLKKSLLQKMFV